MKVILFGATGMVGQGVLRECLLDADVESVLAVGRSSVGQTHPKLRELLDPDLYTLDRKASDLRGFDACFFCLGVSSAGMAEDAYRRVTFDLTLAVANTLVKLNPQMTFIYVSGQSTDSTEKGRIMWARVKGATENALLRLPFKAAVMFRPGGIEPMHGIKSKTPSYRFLYALTQPLWPVMRRCFPKYVTSTEQIGHAMLKVVKTSAPKSILETTDINAL
jgi:uncharacterized protein YbjT (DUF2867 family)